MFGRIATFELRYQIGSPVFWVVAALFFLLTFGSVTVEEITIGGGGNIHVNAPGAIARTQQILSIFFMFVTTAFVANVIVRDDDSGFGPIVRSTQVTRFDYLLGRFTGAFLTAAAAFLVVPLAIWLGSMMPWVDAETVGPNHLSYYAQAYLLLALPNLLITSAIFFSVATVTRSVMYSYVAVVIFLVAWTVFNSVSRSNPEWREALGFVEPFGMAAVSSATRYWTASEANTLLVPLTTPLLVNRLIWSLLALAALALAYTRFTFSQAGLSKRKLRRQARTSARLSRTEPVIVADLPPASPATATWCRLRTLIGFEMAQLFHSPAFLVLMLVGLFNAVGGLLFANEIYGTPTRPLTFTLLETLIGSFSIIPIIIAIYYGGELVWRDRDRRMHEIVDATSLPNWAYVVPKALAVTTVLASTLGVSIVAAVLVQLFRGGGDLSIGKYVLWYLLPLTVDMALIAVLSVFVQALSPNKYVGWAVMVVYLVATITLTTIGFEHPLYQYGSGSQVRFSDINGTQIGGAAGWWFRLYWSAFALILLTLAHLLWRRGTETRLRPRLRRVPSRLVGMPGAIIAGAGVVFVTTGAYAFYNTNILNTYRTRDDGEARQAAYERKFLKYEKLPTPSVTTVAATIALYPRERRMEVRGRYLFVNDTGAPLAAVHVRLPSENTRIVSIAIAGACLTSSDANFQYRIYRFDTPLASGATGSLDFVTRREQRGFRATGDDILLVANGSFLDNSEIMPQLGMDKGALLVDPVKRRKQGLPSHLRMAKLEDRGATARNYVLNAPWVMSDITVSTDADQTPIAPGRKLRDRVGGGRRTARFVSTAPILAFFSVQSARYAVARDRAGPVALEVYYHPAHGFNTARMLDAMKRSLDYYRRAFGPYQFDYARIVEFPGYRSFAQAFAGTIPFSEKIGFIADTRDADEIDYVSYVTAHEMAHQYWAHQLVSADMQGGTMLVETMAQYSALMVMKRQFGDDKIRRFLKYELDAYLASRGSETIEELPLDRVENQGYIHYRKGALVMYLLQDRLGEDRVNTLLRDLLTRYRFKGRPYASSLALLDGFRTLARTPAERSLVDDLLDRITIYDFKTAKASARRLADGNWETLLTVRAAKVHADGQGVEKPSPFADDIDIGLFTARPGVGAFDRSDVVVMKRRFVHSGEQQIRLISRQRPIFAGVDPYNKYVDRNGDDNLIEITE